jgi:hypothetical protein
MRLLISIFFFSIYSLSIAAPYPLTGSSLFLNNKRNLYLWPFKIDLNLQKSPYEVDLAQNDSDKWTIKSSDNEIQVFVRMKKLGSNEDYDKSLKSWIREYEKSGFQIVAQQIPRKNAEQGWIHLQDSQEKQLLQYFRFQNRLWVYFNCIGKKQKLSSLKQTCEFLSSKLQFL